MGNSIGGTHKRVGSNTTTEVECAEIVSSKEPNANGATRGQTTGSCYARFEVTGTDCNSDFKTCFFLSRCSKSKRSVEVLSKTP